MVPGERPQRPPGIHAECPCGHGGATPHPLHMRLGQTPIRGICMVRGLPPEESGPRDTRVEHEPRSMV